MLLGYSNTFFDKALNMQSGFSYSREMLCDYCTQVSVNFKVHQQHVEINFLNAKHFLFSLYLCYCLLSCISLSLYLTAYTAY